MFKYTIKERQTMQKEISANFTNIRVWECEIDASGNVYMFVESDLNNFDRMLTLVPENASIWYEIGSYTDNAGYDGQKDEYAASYSVSFRWTV